MNFSAWSIRNPVGPILLFVMLMILGWQSFNSLPVTRFPNIDVPLVAVTATQAGAAPAELETQVTKKIEDAVAGITGVKNVFSTLADGVSTTAVEFRMDVPTDKAVQDVKDAIDQIAGDLPGDIDTPIVTRIDVEGQAIMTFAVASPGRTLEEISWFVDDVVTRGLQGQPGIGRVDRYGGADREIRVELDPLRLDSFGISAASVSQQLRLTNTDQGAGRSEIGGGEQAIRTLGDASTAAKLAETTISLPNGRFVRLSELGEVVDTYEEPRSMSRFNGEQVVTFGVFRAKGASEVSVAEVVNATLDGIRVKHPDVQIKPVDDTVSYTYGNYEAALHTLIEGALLAVIVVLLFLKNWRATLISAVALPLSAIPTFYVMDLLGFSLNLVSFLAMTLATGILVDDAIVEIENIARHIRMGKTPYRAAIEAADEIGLAVIATTMTIVAVFVPVSFMPGIPGQYFRQFGLTVAIAVLISLLVARLITPMMAAYLMRAKDAVRARAEGRPGHARLSLDRAAHGDGAPAAPAEPLVAAEAGLWPGAGRECGCPAAVVPLPVTLYHAGRGFCGPRRLADLHGADSGQLHSARGCQSHPRQCRTAAGIDSGRYGQDNRGDAAGDSGRRRREERVCVVRVVAQGRTRHTAGELHGDSRPAGPFAAEQGCPDHGFGAGSGADVAGNGTGRTPAPAEPDRGRGVHAGSRRSRISARSS